MRRFRTWVIGSTVIAVALATGAVVTSVAANSAPLADSPAAGAFHPIAPTRIIDTRINAGGGHRAAVPAHGILTFRVTGTGGVPTAGVGAVVITLTITQPAAGGYVTAYAAGAARPSTSTLNFTAGRTVANAAVVTPDAAGRVSVFNASAGSLHVVADESGYYTGGSPTAPGGFAPLAPHRILDTRSGLGARKASVPAHSDATVTVAGRGGVPATDVTVVVMNLTATSATANGYLSADAVGVSRRSSLNFAAGVTDANLAIVTLDDSGRVVVYNGSSRPVQVIGDVLGYVRGGATTSAGMTSAYDQSTLLDTRTGVGTTKRQVPAHGTVSVHGYDHDTGRPVSALAVHVTATAVTAGGYVTAYGGSAPRPVTSTLNFTPGRSTSDLAFVQPGGSGVVTFYNGSSRPIDLIVDTEATTALGTPHLESVPTDNAFHATGVSCASTTFCVAVGQTADRDQWARFDGTRWSDPALFRDDDYTRGPLTVACPSASFCLATDGANSTVFDGTEWSAAAPMDILANLDDPPDLACTADQMCLLTGETAAGRSMAFSYRHGWVQVADPPEYVAALSCAATICTAVGVSTSDSTPSASTFDGASWSAPHVLPLVPKDISCSTAGCVVVGRTDAVRSLTPTASVTYVDGQSSPLVAMPPLRVGGDLACVSITHCLWLDDDVSTGFDGQHWSAPEPVHAGRPSTRGAVLSCARADFCQAVATGGAVLRWDGRWSGTPAFAGFPVAVSCSSASSCRSADGYGTVSAWDGVHWIPTGEHTGLDPAQAMDCTSASRCVAVGLADGNPAASAWNGATWSVPAPLPGMTSVSDVSCAGSTFCMAVGHAGAAVADRFDGVSWSPSNVGSKIGALGNVSCASSTLCAAISSRADDSTLDVLTFDGTRWLDHSGETANSFGLVSCAKGSTRCVLALSGSNTYTFTGHSWALLNHGTNRDVDALDCRADGTCVAGISGLGFVPGVMALSGGLWTDVRNLPSSGFPITDLSCPTTEFCAAVRL